MYLEGKLVRMISMRVPVFTALGWYLVGSLIICVRLRASSLDCRRAGVVKLLDCRGQYFRFWQQKKTYTFETSYFSGPETRICI